jgi:hypothetical protein
MSKQVDVRFTCPQCGHSFETKLYRSIWIEYPELRELIFSDRINIVECKKCKKLTDVPFSLLATNVKRHIAVWFEPFDDEQIDVDKAAYEKVYGPGNFYADAPRVSDWNEFKETILKFERGELVGLEPSRMNLGALKEAANQGSSQPRRPSFLSRLFKRK